MKDIVKTAKTQSLQTFSHISTSQLPNDT